MNSPFKFLDAYTAKDKSVFFGREREIEELYQKLMMTSLVLVYGLSGTGKTSLVRCGLAKRFRGPDWYPLYIRRGEDLNRSLHQNLAEKAGMGEGDEYSSNLEQIYEQLSGEEGASIVQIAAPQRALSANLASSINQLYARRLRPIYLVFDQFEEIFTIGNEEEQRVFAENLRDLVDGDLPCKVILVMREEYIGYLYYFEEVLPSINDFRIRLEAMEDKRVMEVIRKSCAAFNITLEDVQKTPELILEKLRGKESERAGPRARIQLPYLQVYLDGLYRHVLEETDPATAKLDELPVPLPKMTFTAAAIEAYGSIENVLGNFLENQINRIQEDLKKDYTLVPNEAVREVIDQFVTVDGTKRPLHPEEIDVTNLKEEPKKKIIAALLEARILRPEGGRFELAHDALAYYIDEQRSDEEKRFKEIIDFLKTKFDQYKRKLTGRLSAHEVALVRSHPNPDDVKEKLSRSEWSYFKESENRVLLRRFLWAIVGFGILLILLFTSVGVNLYQNSLLNQKKELLKEGTVLTRELNENRQGPFREEDFTRIIGLIEEDKDEQAYQVVDSLLTELRAGPDPGSGPSGPPVEPGPEPEPVDCQGVIENTRTALEDNSQEPCESREAFLAFQQAFDRGACPAQQEIMNNLNEDIFEKYKGLVIAGRKFKLAGDAASARTAYEKAACLMPAKKAEVDELIEELDN